jgi:surfeit locus 1 family protein
MRHVPILPTILVALAALLMARLGVWQLHRLHEKEALLARYAANADRRVLPLEALFPMSEADLYRRVSATCLRVVGWTTEAGRDARGTAGWRHIARCATGAEGPGFAADVGISGDPGTPAWTGGRVTGRLIAAPSPAPLVARLVGQAPPPTPMIVSAAAAPGLAPTVPPNPADVPNNHLSYAVQWFLFTATAVLIYAVALWQRARKLP